MKKLIYLSLAAALMGVTSCKNEEADIFTDTAANRLEQFKKEYTGVLCSEGGRWALEYFANTEEPGYVFVVDFKGDHSVDISANNKWVPASAVVSGSFGKASSLWEIIGDDGPVLTFNTYNSVFHVFSSPDNIEGGPTYNNGQSDVDINETGRGHEGDYEFVIMGVSEDGQTVTLQGKKRSYKAYLHRLAPEADADEYLAKVYDNAHRRVTNEFGYNIIHETTTDQRFTVTEVSDKYMQGHAGYFEAYPQGGDSVMQTVDLNAIITHDGLRFRHEFSIPRADVSADPIKVFDFVFQADGSMKGVSNPDVIYRAPMLAEICCNHSIEVAKKHSWSFEEYSLGDATPLLETIKQKLTAQFNGKRNFSGLGFTTSNVNSVPTPSFYLNFGTAAAHLYLGFTRVDDNTVRVTTDGVLNSNGETIVKTIPEIKELLEKFCGTYTLTADDILNPYIIHWQGDNGISFDAVLKR